MTKEFEETDRADRQTDRSSTEDENESADNNRLAEADFVFFVSSFVYDKNRQVFFSAVKQGSEVTSTLNAV